MTKLLLLLFSLLGLLSSSLGATGCQQRHYGEDSVVCVCNQAKCDDFPPLKKTTSGVATVYSSSKSGDRFASHQLHFSPNAPGHPGAVSVEIDRSRKYQKIQGFGGAFTDSAGFNIGFLPKELQTRLIRDYFSSDGLEYSMARVPIGGTDFSTRGYTYDDHPNDDSLSKFTLQEEDHKYKIPLMKLAQQVSPRQLKYFGSPWSPPAWLKENNNLIHGGLLKGHPGGKYYKIFANYFVRFLQEYQKNGVHLWGITIENEPGAGFIKDYKWNSLALNATLERDFLKHDLGPALHQHGFGHLKVIIHDDDILTIKKFTETVMQDPEAAKYVSGTGLHWYFNYQGHWEDLDYLFQKFPHTFILGTEACDNYHERDGHIKLGAWEPFNKYAEDIFKNLNHYSTGWVDWNMALGLKGGPSWVGNVVNAPIIVNHTGHEYYKQPIFYAMGHFSKFLPPDSVRLHHRVTSANLILTVFDRSDKGTVLIVLNKNNHPVELQVNDPNRGFLSGSVKANSMQSFLWY